MSSSDNTITATQALDKANYRRKVEKHELFERIRIEADAGKTALKRTGGLGFVNPDDLLSLGYKISHDWDDIQGMLVTISWSDTQSTQTLSDRT